MPKQRPSMRTRMRPVHPLHFSAHCRRACLWRLDPRCSSRPTAGKRAADAQYRPRFSAHGRSACCCCPAVRSPLNPVALLSLQASVLPASVHPPRYSADWYEFCWRLLTPLCFSFHCKCACCRRPSARRACGCVHFRRRSAWRRPRATPGRSSRWASGMSMARGPSRTRQSHPLVPARRGQGHADALFSLGAMHAAARGCPAGTTPRPRAATAWLRGAGWRAPCTPSSTWACVVARGWSGPGLRALTACCLDAAIAADDCLWVS